MRENRLSGLEGGVAFGPSLPLSRSGFWIRAKGAKGWRKNFSLAICLFPWQTAV